MADKDRSEDLREENDPENTDPLLRNVREVAREGSLLGKVDAVVDPLAETVTAGRPGHRAGEDLPDLDPDTPASAETGTGVELLLTADDKREVHLGDELEVRLSEAASAVGWTYEVEGDFRAVDVYESAELVTPGASEQNTPAVGGCWRFVVRAERKGKATVRFEPLDTAAGVAPLRLRITVR